MTMLGSSLVLLATSAALVAAATPAGFQPAAQNPLIISYGGIAAMNGVNLPKQSTAKVPTIATEQPLQGKYAIFMIDMDIPTNAPPQTSTLLHWAQAGLTSNPVPTILNTTMGTKQVHVMQNLAATPAMADYFGPNPPALMPLQHRYAFVAVDHSTISRDGLGQLTLASQQRRGFDATRTLTAAGLGPQNVVAGNFYMVSNTGPIRDGSGAGLPGQPGQPNGGISPAPGMGGTTPAPGNGGTIPTPGGGTGGTIPTPGEQVGGGGQVGGTPGLVGGGGTTPGTPLGATQPAQPGRAVSSAMTVVPSGRVGVACICLAAVAVFMGLS
ncbi:phosphatidylethanolamine-binding protein [Plectosphaerella plurivora]|uniref:Phosphatidylethanolamine-binding protein n=1 Tax=Plectosphaerella plurivora TaxID=936078 RepID=A0A9P8VAP5_9PEZI|nr:phosphatidylethanolamine-binding protein [Plectosphaerella plurivora]